jgi:hypothetical protein
MSEPEGLDQKLVAAIYARQSRVRDIAYSSCQSQIDMCRDLAASRDWSITQVYSDEGYSSETLDRPQMSQLIAAIEMGDVRRLVGIWSIETSHGSRSAIRHRPDKLVGTAVLSSYFWSPKWFRLDRPDSVTSYDLAPPC